jgi:glycosyltransferase involved in cell wall biosynthesis
MHPRPADASRPAEAQLRQLAVPATLEPMNRPALPKLSDNPLVSVIMTSYNYARFVGQAIESVFIQTHGNCELIVVDDGSTDGSPEVIRKTLAGAPFPASAVHQENRGQAAAMNAGFVGAKGEVVAFLDSDDHWGASKLEEMLAFMRNHPDGGVYQHQVEDGRGKPVLDPLCSGDYYHRWLEVGEVNTAIRRDLFLVFAPTSGLVFRKAVLDQIFPLPEQLVACPDTFLVFLSCRFGPLYSSPRTLGVWRCHDSNAGKQNRFGYKKYGVSVVLEAVNDRFRELGEPILLTYRPFAVLWEPVRLVREALARRSKRTTR